MRRKHTKTKLALIAILASVPLVASSSPRDVVHKAYQKLHKRAKKEFKKQLYAQRKVKFVDLNRAATSGEVRYGGNFGLQLSGQLHERANTGEQQAFSASNPNHQWLTVGGTMNMGARGAIPLGQFSITPSANAQVVYSMTTALDRSNARSVVNDTGRLKPPMGYKDLAKLPQGSRVRLLLKGKLGLAGSIGRGITLADGSLGSIGANLSATLSHERTATYEVVIERRGAGDAHVMVREIKANQTGAYLAANVGSNPSLDSLLPSISNSLLDRGVDKAVGKAESLVKSYVRANASMSATRRNAVKSEKAYLIDLTSRETADAEHRVREQADRLSLSASVGKLTIAQRISNSSEKTGSLTLDNGQRYRYRRELLSGQRDGLLSNMHWLTFSEGKRNRAEELVTVTNPEGQSRSYLHANYQTDDRRTSRDERKAFRAFAEFFGAPASAASETEVKRTVRRANYYLSDKALAQLAALVDVQRGKLTAAGKSAVAEAVDKAFHKITPYRLGSRAHAKLPFADPNADRHVVSMLKDFSVFGNMSEDNVSGDYHSYTRGRSIEKDAKAYEQYERVSKLVVKLAQGRAQGTGGLTDAHVPMGDFLLRGAVMAQLAGKRHVKADLSIADANGRASFSYQSRAENANFTDPQNWINKVLHDPSITSLE